MTGGEPLLYENFYELYAFLKQNDCHKTLVTNGYLLDNNNKKMDIFDDIHISFHSFTEKGWLEITGTSTLKIVKKNIIKLRKENPAKNISLNIVSEENNNNKEEIQKYLSFARDYKLKINVFKEGYLEVARKFGLKNFSCRKPAPLWCLSSFNPLIIKEKPRKKTFLVQGVEVTLSYTSVLSSM